MGACVQERQHPGGDLTPVRGDERSREWSEEEVEEEFRALVATLLGPPDTLTAVVPPGPPAPGPARPERAGQRAGDRRPVRRERSPPR